MFIITSDPNREFFYNFSSISEGRRVKLMKDTNNVSCTMDLVVKYINPNKWISDCLAGTYSDEKYFLLPLIQSSFVGLDNNDNFFDIYNYILV